MEQYVPNEHNSCIKIWLYLRSQDHRIIQTRYSITMYKQQNDDYYAILCSE